MKDIDELKGFIETIYDWDTPGLQPLCMVHTIWYLLRCPPQEITMGKEGTPKLQYILLDHRDVIYESIKNMFTEKEQPIPALTSYAFERGLEHLQSSDAVRYIAKKGPGGATMILPPDAQNPDVKPDSKPAELEDLCWIFFKEYDKSKVDELVNYCADDLDFACKGAEIYSWSEIKDEKNEFLDKLDPNDANKLKITQMIERTEDMLRRLLVTKYEKYAGWTKEKEYVPDGIISKMYTDDFELKTCPRCNGSGTIADGEQKCKRCKGKGVVTEALTQGYSDRARKILLAVNEKEVKDIIKLCEKGPLSSKVDHVKVNEYKENYLKKNFDII